MAVRCLLVDDNQVFLRAVRHLLERDGVDVVAVASTGSDALRYCEELRPDVVLLDIELGEESGFDIAQQLNANGRSAGLRVILISSYSADDFADLIADSPALSFLPKPDLSAGAITGILMAAGGGRREVSPPATALNANRGKPARPAPGGDRRRCPAVATGP